MVPIAYLVQYYCVFLSFRSHRKVATLTKQLLQENRVIKEETEKNNGRRKQIYTRPRMHEPKNINLLSVHGCLKGAICFPGSVGAP